MGFPLEFHDDEGGRARLALVHGPCRPRNAREGRAPRFAEPDAILAG